MGTNTYMSVFPCMYMDLCEPRVTKFAPYLLGMKEIRFGPPLASKKEASSGAKLLLLARSSPLDWLGFDIKAVLAFFYRLPTALIRKLIISNSKILNSA